MIKRILKQQTKAPEKNYFRKIKLSKEPKDVFKRCPYCDNKDLLEIEDNVFCTSDSCGWNSISVYQQAQEIYLKALMMNGIY
ncbi:MAG: hypothetical protein N4A33_02920 [Bacteriovoracaceae bacterium]|jgi:hypothetical protein|nr:hypothetical protein [Bacteriovoracaceae bacterium]